MYFYSVFGEAKLCKFDCKYYCFECHQDDERYVPARILFNWDFRKHRVCVRSCEFLDSIETTPVLNIEEINNSLYRYIPELNEVKVILMLESGIDVLHVGSTCDIKSSKGLHTNL